MAIIRYIPIALMLLAAGAASAQQSGKSKTTKQAKAAPAKKAAAATNPANARYNRSAQIKPTADRYADIQKALHDRGYFSGPADGKWGADSVDALKRFQVGQNLEGDGKLGALTLVAMGLGPKRTPTVATAGTPAPPQVE